MSETSSHSEKNEVPLIDVGKIRILSTEGTLLLWVIPIALLIIPSVIMGRHVDYTIWDDKIRMYSSIGFFIGQALPNTLAVLGLVGITKFRQRRGNRAAVHESYSQQKRSKKSSFVGLANIIFKLRRKLEPADSERDVESANPIIVWLFKCSSGDFGLAKSFWLYRVIVSFLLAMIPSIFINEGLVFAAIVSIFIVMSLAAVILMGVWRAASKYEGQQKWSFLAQFYVVYTVSGLPFAGLVYFNSLLAS